MSNPNRPREDDTLLQEALEGLFAIAHEDAPHETQQRVQEQVASLDPSQREDLLDELVNKDRLRIHLEKAQHDEIPATIPGLTDEQMQKIDAVLDPLARLEAGAEAANALQGLTPDKRAQILFDTLTGPAK